MKFQNKIKQLTIVLLTASIAVGCASQQKQETAPKADKGPSASSVAIANAKAAMKKAKAVGYLWRDTGKFIKKAEKAAKGGNEGKAVKLANKARSQAEMAVKQYYYEQGIERALPSMEDTGMAYSVIKGDSLWGIAGKDGVYGNPYQWPLIYKANSDKIQDADLIFPGQEFDINTSASDEEASAAVNHAKTRGAWSIGVAEESDKAYLAK